MENIIYVLQIQKTAIAAQISAGVPKLFSFGGLNGGPRAKGKHLVYCIVKMQNNARIQSPLSECLLSVSHGLCLSSYLTYAKLPSCAKYHPAHPTR